MFEADLGVVISASHNPYDDNGIKFFDRSGSKLSDDIEREIESNLQKAAITLESSKLGKAKRIDTARIRYQEFCASTFPADLKLDGVKVVFDGANGAGYKVGPANARQYSAPRSFRLAVRRTARILMTAAVPRVLSCCS